MNNLRFVCLKHDRNSDNVITLSGFERTLTEGEVYPVIVLKSPDSFHAFDSVFKKGMDLGIRLITVKYGRKTNLKVRYTTKYGITVDQNFNCGCLLVLNSDGFLMDFTNHQFKTYFATVDVDKVRECLGKDCNTLLDSDVRIYCLGCSKRRTKYMRNYMREYRRTKKKPLSEIK